MERLDRILIGLKRPEQDAWLTAYAGAIARAAGAREIHVLHVEPPPPRPGEPAPGARPAVTTPDQLRSAAAALQPADAVELIPCIATAPPMVEILRYAMDRDIDLIVLGRRGPGQTSAREEVLARRITSKATCSVLVVPEAARMPPRRILVPVRNSDCSARAVEAACTLATPAKADVCCLNVFPVRGEYLEVDLTLEEHAALMRQWAQRENEQLLANLETHGTPVHTQCEPDLHARPANVILEVIGRESADLVVIGARGRTGAAGVLLGAVTEQLILHSPVPVLAVKKKGECIGVLRALLSLTG